MTPTHFATLTSLAAATLLIACSSDPNPAEDTGTPVEDTGDDTCLEGCDDTGEPDTNDGDADEDVDPDTDVEPDTDDTDVEEDTTPEPDPSGPPPLPCEEGAAACSDNAFVLWTCTAGAWEPTHCMADDGLLCDEDASGCVPSWEWGDPTWSTCADYPLATEESLAEKAAYFEDIAQRLHVHPDLGWMMPVTLRTEEVPCEDGVEGPCYDLVTPEAEATFADIARWHSGENDGLWSGLYLAAEAFRYGATEDPEALEMIRLMVDAELDRMRVTGVPGLFARQLIPPGVDGLSCPDTLEHYIPDGEEKDDNRWVMINDEGCAEVVDPDTMEWVTTDHCGQEEYAGYCWLDNVSQDEYAGHMFALAALDLLVDDPEVQAAVDTMIEEVGVHLMENDLAFIDWDGRLTEHGRLWAFSLVQFPGFLAAETLAFVRMAATVSDREDLWDFYEGCLLQRDDRGACIDRPVERPMDYSEHLPDVFLYPGDGCTANYNNFSMEMAYLFTLMLYENDPQIRQIAQTVMDEVVMRPDHPRAIIDHGNAWYNFMWAVMRPLGPATDGQDFDAVEDAICSLRAFPASQAAIAQDNYADYEYVCDTRLDHEATDVPIPIEDRCMTTFTWWKNPYQLRSCSARPEAISAPADYLLPYWMGRYYGMIDETM